MLHEAIECNILCLSQLTHQPFKHFRPQTVFLENGRYYIHSFVFLLLHFKKRTRFETFKTDETVLI